MKFWLEEIFLNGYNKNRLKDKTFIKLYGKEIYYKIIDLTNFLSQDCKLSERIYCILNNIQEIPKCDYCKNSFVKFNSFINGYKKYCSCSCSAKGSFSQREETNLKIYNTKHPSQNFSIKEKTKQTNLKRYGHENFFSTKHFKNKSKETSYEKYGVDNPAKSLIIKEKTKITNNNIFGTDYPILNSIIKNKAIKTLISNYNVIHPLKSFTIKEQVKKTNKQKHGTEYISQKHYTLEQLEIVNNLDKLKKIYQEHINEKIPVNILSLKYGFSSSLLGKLFIKNNFKIKRFSKSYQEKLIKLFLDELNIDYIQNDRKILNGKELDFYIPDYKLGIEINGFYWHDEHSKLGKYNLLDKYNLCKEKNIKLLNFWEIEIENKFEIIKSIIKDNLELNQEIKVNDCIKEISQEESYKFYENNHILGGISCDYNYGLYYEEELLYCIGINKVEEGYEIIRDCTKIGYKVLGRLDKLLNYNKDFVIKLDKRLFNIIEYEEKGFKIIKETPPNLLFYKGKNLYSYSVNNSKKIYDCGNIILNYNKKFIN